MTLYERDNWLDTRVEKLVNKQIIEYDLKSANTSLCREYGLLPKDKIDKIDALPKEKRTKRIGVMMRDDKVFKDALVLAFKDIRRRFFEENNLSDEDVLAIKKDAIFVKGEVPITDFGDCHFIPKNEYTSYLYLNRFELYYSERFGESRLDVKGMNDEDLKKHEDYMLFFIRKFFHVLQADTWKGSYQYLYRFISKYKKRELEVGFYREFSHENVFKMIDEEETYDDEIFIPYEDKSEHVDISYNYFNILMPLVKMLI